MPWIKLRGPDFAYIILGILAFGDLRILKWACVALGVFHAGMAVLYFVSRRVR
jgi:hypothetical protein